MTDTLATVVFNALEGMRDKPSELARYLRFYSEEFDTDIVVVQDVISRIANSGEGDPVRLKFHRSLIAWDYVEDAPWIEGTEPNTKSRRERLYECLKLTPVQADVIDKLLPFYKTEHASTIAVEHKLWFGPERQQDEFYWTAYRRYLEDSGNWTSEALQSLGASSYSVVARLADPISPEIYQSKGLVVGYVQSGKTANFTAVVARAADAGYRMVIVLAGMTEILRRQTQRRLDKELVGVELLEDDYAQDSELTSFLSHGGRPSERGYFDWQRLTTREYDYQSLKRGIDALEFERADPSKPVFAPENLRRTKARLIVVKKNQTVLSKLIADLKSIRTRLQDIPVLVIDDESDQASVNTREKNKKRATINGLIVELLSILPRAQYVGYTATPFANVFIDPDCQEDLFPKDFLVSLPRPPDYMGVRDFYDLDDTPPDDYSSNKKALIRSVVGDDEDAHNLPRALDAYVVAGALKLFRKSKGVMISIRHHTMLVHLSSSIADQIRYKSMVLSLLSAVDYRSEGGLSRLRKIYEDDFKPVSDFRRPDLASPKSFDDLLPFIGEVLSLIGHAPVLMVNGDDDAETPDFETRSVWKILVGGTKLSRGFTVEGLTISYYRRKVSTADTLMQMGRWFGFRRGYSDLVRLFIGTKEPLSKNSTKTINLYDAFGAVCKDEEFFRSRLRIYASLEKRVLPRDIPPLVPAHLLKPTAKNKMFNTEVSFENFGGEWFEKTTISNSDDAIERNWAALEALVETSTLCRTTAEFEKGGVRSFDMVYGILEKEKVLEFLEAYRWTNSNRSAIAREVDFLKGQEKFDPGIQDWIVVFPQLRQGTAVELHKESLIVVERNYVDDDNRVGAISDPPHRVAAEIVALGSSEGVTRVGPSLTALSRPKRAVLLVYPFRCAGEPTRNVPKVGFAALLPKNEIETVLAFRVKSKANPDAITVTIPS